MEVNAQMSGPIIEIRKVMKKDLKEIQYICEKCFPGDDVFEIAETLFEAEHYYVALEPISKEIVGFVIFGIYSIETAHIMIFAVHPAHQQKGIGSEILVFTLDEISKSPISRVRLEVKIDNKQAIQFYEKRGFKIKGKLKEYYDDLSDGFLMVKEL
ncbi:MAG: GNAT family N-acetyltransferase [Candidatus Heimdallarchaeota archaeon]